MEWSQRNRTRSQTLPIQSGVVSALVREKILMGRVVGDLELGGIAAVPAPHAHADAALGVCLHGHGRTGRFGGTLTIGSAMARE